ncbi:LytC protein [Weissella ceti]|uniref:LytC protein n=3 Tax=Lactobacillaceae TaxID=33958 RepID=A0A075TUR1_9LACO|nr:LytC protein [Weissella tructae]AIM62618.1 LytC protein [Weissella ceti]AIM63953.1 LytC protein [Weissella ceti]QVV91686.1 N-acetylmuramoyl-L-alanine amidase [Weissella tructae]
MLKIKLREYWIPLVISGIMIGLAIWLTMFLLYKQQVTVQVNQVPIRDARGYQAKKLGTLEQGEHLQILKRQDNWYEVRREDESTGWVASWLVERKLPLDEITPLSEMTIVVDAGHGGSDPGSLANNGSEEKQYTLETAQKMQSQLESRGANVVMTRSGDTDVTLEEIASLPKKAAADLFVSIHFDAVKKNQARGFTTFYYHDDGSIAFGEAINNELAKRVPEKMPNRGNDFGDYYVLRKNTVPAVLIEGGYIDSDKDFSYIKDGNYQNKLAKSVVAGIDQYNVEKNG